MKKKMMVTAALLGVSMTFAQETQVPAKPVNGPKPQPTSTTKPKLKPVPVTQPIQAVPSDVKTRKELDAQAHKAVEALWLSPISERTTSAPYKDLSKAIHEMKEAQLEESVWKPYLDLEEKITGYRVAQIELSIAKSAQDSCGVASS